MAISEVHYRILKKLRENGTLPSCESILNIGQPNWYGDMDYRLMIGDLAKTFVGDTAAMSSVQLAEFCYENLFEATTLKSIDAGGDERAIKADLNDQLVATVAGLSVKMFSGRPPFDLVVNHGTAEHVFNVSQVFRTMHDHCRVGGHMIHEAPCTGWVDHGFYCLQPTLFYDVAAANGYEVKFMAFEHIQLKRILPIESREAVSRYVAWGGPPVGSLLFVVLHKTADREFQIPQQGVYAGTVSDQVKLAWKELR